MLSLAQAPTWLVMILMILFILISVLMILVILIQKPKGGGLAGAFGGGGGGGSSQAVFGAKVGDVLTWVTVGFFAAFLFLAIGLVYAIKHPGQISGVVFIDANNNATIDSGEIGVEGVTVYLDQTVNGELDENEPVLKTDADGRYEFIDPGRGLQTVRIVVPDDYALLTPASGMLEIEMESSSQISANNHFALAEVDAEQAEPVEQTDPTQQDPAISGPDQEDQAADTTAPDMPVEPQDEAEE